MKKTARIYDIKSNKISTIPAAELAPGMVHVEVEGIGRVWVSATDLKPNDAPRHRRLSQTMQDDIRRIKAALDEVRPMTLEAWEDRFRKDAHPEREIAVWSHIASTYIRCIEGRRLQLEQRQDYFKVIAVCSLSTREAVFEVFEPTVISKQEAEHAVELFFSQDQ